MTLITLANFDLLILLILLKCLLPPIILLITGLFPPPDQVITTGGKNILLRNFYERAEEKVGKLKCFRIFDLSLLFVHLLNE
ncbi:hypothetical protein OIU78_009827 [Salix suchowensis]|nr:hypothetical protein OIU78_009827 [Salix suchowensis]